MNIDRLNTEETNTSDAVRIAQDSLRAEIVRQFTDGLTWDPKGIWIPSLSQAVSYPDEGHALCAAIEDNSFWFRHRNRVITAAVSRFPPPAIPIFDFGGGNGFVALDLKRTGFETILVEPGRTGALTAVHRGVGMVICASVETAGFRSETLPAIGMFDVLEHIANDLEFLRMIRGLLRSGGQLYVTVPAFEWLWSSEDEFAGHFRRYTIRSLTWELRKAGFVIDFASYFFTILPPAIITLRTIPTKLGLRKSTTSGSWNREHASDSKLFRWLLDTFLNWEVRAIARGQHLPVGSSCLCVARVDERKPGLVNIRPS